MVAVLEVRNLEKVYAGRGASTRALAGVSLSAEKGDFVGIMGASGSGKTTLLNCIATIDAPTSGTVLINGQDVTKLKSRALADFRREELGFVFQNSNLLDTLTCRENIALPLTIGRVPAGEISARIMGLWHQLWVSRGFSTSFPTRCPAASASAWRQPAP